MQAKVKNKLFQGSIEDEYNVLSGSRNSKASNCIKDDKDLGPDKESAMISGKIKRKNLQYTLSTQPPFNRFTGN